MNYINMSAAPEAVIQGDLIVVNGTLATVESSHADAPGWVIEYSWRSANGRIDTSYLWFDPDLGHLNSVALVETRNSISD